jgi:5-amino-6-(5-phospho-D-ribitylamino)uracil phosphatase
MSESDYRLIAIDLDGTLLSPKGVVTPRTRAAVQAAVAAGFVVCFATGRSWRESGKILDSVGHLDAAVFATGALVIDTHQRRTLHRRLMGAELSRQVCRFFESHGQAALALQDHERAGVDYLATKGAELNSDSYLWFKLAQADVTRRDDLATADHIHTVRVSIVSDDAAVYRCHEGLDREFGPRVGHHNLVVQSSGMRVLEVFEPTVSKWAGVLDVARRHGILPRQIIAIGDDVNDLPMITRAGLGVAMGNAPKPVQAKAARVIGHNREEGLAVFLEELIGNNGKVAKGLALFDGPAA